MEEAPDPTTDLGLESLGFELGAAPTSGAPKSNPFGITFPNTATNPASSPFNSTVPTWELFRPASFSLQQPSQPANMSAFSSHFAAPEPAKSLFGQPAQIGPGQQALGSVLGDFGQSRQLGTSFPGTGFAAANGFGSGGFTNAGTPSGVFANAATGGFAGVASTAGGFSGIASGAMGFAAASASTGGGFAGAAGGGGFAGAAGGGGGFGAFSNQQGGGGFSGFGSSPSGSGQVPSQLFTQMRR